MKYIATGCIFVIAAIFLFAALPNIPAQSMKSAAGQPAPCSNTTSEVVKRGLIPNIVGCDPRILQSQLGHSIILVKQGEAPSQQRRGMIASQSISPGSSFKIPTELGYTVSTGPSTKTPPQNRVVDVLVRMNLTTPRPYRPGQPIQYSIAIRNPSKDFVTSVLVDAAPTNLTFSEVSGDGCKMFPCTIPSIDPGAIITLEAKATINNSGYFNNRVTVQAAQPDPDISNNNTGDIGGETLEDANNNGGTNTNVTNKTANSNNTNVNSSNNANNTRNVNSNHTGPPFNGSVSPQPSRTSDDSSDWLDPPLILLPLAVIVLITSLIIFAIVWWLLKPPQPPNPPNQLDPPPPLPEVHVEAKVDKAATPSVGPLTMTAPPLQINVELKWGEIYTGPIEVKKGD